MAALSLALQPGFAGDRVAAFVYAAADTIITAHGNRTSFTLVDGLDPQHIFNAARNLEIANWILNSRKAANGQPLLLSNQMAEDGRNLSFEREMGKITNANISVGISDAFMDAVRSDGEWETCFPDTSDPR